MILQGPGTSLTGLNGGESTAGGTIPADRRPDTIESSPCVRRAERGGEGRSMAGVIQRFEQRLEGVVTGAFAAPSAAPSSPSRSPPPCSARSTTRPTPCPATGCWPPTSSWSSCPQPDYERLAPFGDTLAAELGRLVEEHVAEQRYTLTGPLEHRLRRGRRPRHRPLPGAQQHQRRRHAGGRRADDRDRDPRVRRRSSRSTACAIRSSAGRRDRPRQRGRAAHQRPGHLPQARPDLGHDRRPGRHEVTVHDLGSTNGVILNGQRVSDARSATARRSSWATPTSSSGSPPDRATPTDQHRREESDDV